MICVLLCDRARDTIDDYLLTWARALRGKLFAATYESLPLRRSLSAGTFVFADLERLTDAECARADALAERVERAGGRVLNRPAVTLRRFDLLRTLHGRGLNTYNVHRAETLLADPGAMDAVRFPVFAREEREHSGALTDLIPDATRLRAALQKLPARNGLMVAEFVETRPGGQGPYRKYSYQRIGDHFVFRHVLFSGDWVDKTPDVVSEITVTEEQDYLRTQPHLGAVKEIFDVAKVDYGRIDYALHDGRLVTWEINTNPTILPPPETCDPLRIGDQSRSAAAINAALARLAGERAPVTVNLLGLKPVVATQDYPLDRRAMFAAMRLLGVVAKADLGKRLLHAAGRAINEVVV